MSLTIELSPEEEKVFVNAARRHGVTVNQLARQTLLTTLPLSSPLDDKTLALFAQWEAEDATEDANEIARRIADWEALKADLNANRAADGEALLFP